MNIREGVNINLCEDITLISCSILYDVGRDTSGGIGTRYWLDSLEIESWCRRDIPYLSLMGPTQPAIQ